jgi:hypothetical protein
VIDVAILRDAASRLLRMRAEGAETPVEETV